MGKYKNLLLNTGLFAFNTFATKIITFLLVPLYTFYLSATQFGITDMSLTVISLVFPIMSLSIPDAVLRFVINDRNNADSYISLGYVEVILGCVVLAAMLPLLDLHFFGGLGQYKGLFYFAFVCNALWMLCGNVARALNQIKLIPIASIISSLTTAATGYILIAHMGMKVDGYFYSIIFGSILSILTYIVWGKQYKHLRFNFTPKDFALTRQMLIYSIPLIPNSIFWMIGTSINRFFITGMIGISASGLFAAATKIPNLINMLTSIFQQAWTLSAFQEFKHNNISRFFSVIFKIFQALMTMGSSFIILLVQPLSHLFLQKQFFSSWYLIPILILATFFNAMNTFYGTIYTSSMKTRYLFTTTVIGSVSCVALTWLLIPIVDLQGAAIAMAVSNAIVLIMRVINSRSILKFEINWICSLSSISLLICQAVLVTVQLEHFMLLSLFATLLIICIEVTDLVPAGKAAMQLIHKQKIDFQVNAHNKRKK